MPPPRRPRVAAHFRLTLAGKGAVDIRECSGLGSQTQVVEYREGSAPDVVRKIPGSSEWSEIEVKRGFDGDVTLWSWRDQVMKQGPGAARVDGKIELFDHTGAAVATYQFKQGWPAKYELHVQAGEPPLESVTIVHEGLERL